MKQNLMKKTDMKCQPARNYKSKRLYNQSKNHFPNLFTKYFRHDPSIKIQWELTLAAFPAEVEVMFNTRLSTRKKL